MLSGGVGMSDIPRFATVGVRLSVLLMFKIGLGVDLQVNRVNGLRIIC